MSDSPIGGASEDGTAPDLTTTVSVDDLQIFSIIVVGLADAEVMDEAWR